MDRITSTVFDMGALRKAEQGYRRQLEQEPGDTATRLGLAWCLVVQALFEAGQEETLGQLLAAASPSGPAAPERIPATLSAAEAAAERDSRTLLRSSLQQALLVSQLSTDPQEKSDSEWLRALIRLSGGEQALVEAEEEAVTTMRTVTGAVLRPPDALGTGGLGPPRPRLRRYCRRADGRAG